MPGIRTNNSHNSVAPSRRKQRRSHGTLVQRRSLPSTSLLGLSNKGSEGSVKRTSIVRRLREDNARQAGEPLRTLHSDIRRLTALAFPDIDYAARERIACDYVVDVLDETNFALRVRERTPHDLDSALQVAEPLEVWMNITYHPERLKKYLRDRRTREVAPPTANKPKKTDQTEAVLKPIKQLEMRVSKAEATANTKSSAKKPNEQ